MMNRVRILENQQENLVESSNQSISYLQQQISILNGDISNLKEQIDELKPEVSMSDDENIDADNKGNITESEDQTSVNDNGLNENTTITGAQKQLDDIKDHISAIEDWLKKNQ